jgi:hypothetical protein
MKLLKSPSPGAVQPQSGDAIQAQFRGTVQAPKNEKAAPSIFPGRPLDYVSVTFYSAWFYSSSSNCMASLVVCSNSYSSLLPTIMFSKSRRPVPAGIG